MFHQVQNRNATFMLNVGPRPFGDIHPEERMVLRRSAPGYGVISKQ